MFLKIVTDLENQGKLFFFASTLRCPEQNIGQAPLSYQESALALTHMLLNHTAIRQCNWRVNTWNEVTWDPYDEESLNDGLFLRYICLIWLFDLIRLLWCYLVQLLNNMTQVQFPISSGFPGFGSESIRQMALHSQFTLIGHKETCPDNALSCFCLQNLLNPSFLSNLKIKISCIKSFKIAVHTGKKSGVC